ncbi:Hypothetical predicted protein [Cloeon dipterum]|uniref:Signal peptide, CUB and EGF-like domain-containing protein 2 n=3 Tax=Cloeon dipterum TaxID=197152 RepID=A0A8S1BVR1_9INSE|nr:Hypothetical predicted protein [Cloeon dipterum]
MVRCYCYIERMIWLFLMLSILIDGAQLHVENVHVNLRKGVVIGYSDHVQFMDSPSSNETRPCSKSFVMRISFEQDFKAVKLSFKYKRPKSWMLHISDQYNVEGYGQGEPRADLELQVVNSQMRVYGHSKVPMLGLHKRYFIAENTPRVLQRVLDGTIKPEFNSEMIISSGHSPSISWHNGQLLEMLPAPSKPFSAIYVALNSALNGPWLPGSGMCSVDVTMMKDEGQCLKTGGQKCDENAFCRPGLKNNRCTCKQGWQGNGKTCTDVNECLIRNGGCVHYCENTLGSYQCWCRDGFVTDPENDHNCIDKDECAAEESPPCEDRLCINTIGSFYCQCKSYPLKISDDGKNSCKPTTDRCLSLGCTHGCNPEGSASCWCREHFFLNHDLRSCSPKCSGGNGGCQHRCTEVSNGAIFCTCALNYKLGFDTKSCHATCAVNNGGCEHVCSLTGSKIQCSCLEGYNINDDGKTCSDINECLEPLRCAYRCLNSIGSYECLCPDGFRLNPDGRSCEDVNECELKNICDHECVNTQGSFHCRCKPGYQLYSKLYCGDIDECSIDNGGCDQFCVNTEGSFHCSCQHGYRLHFNEKDCVDSMVCYPLKQEPKTEVTCVEKGDATITCDVRCTGNASLTTEEPQNYFCGRPTEYEWEQGGKRKSNNMLLSCSDMVQPTILVTQANVLMTGLNCNESKLEATLEKANIFFEKMIGKIECSKPGCNVTVTNADCEYSPKSLSKANTEKGNTYKLTLSIFLYTDDIENKLKRLKKPNSGRKNTQKGVKKVLSSFRKSINRGNFHTSELKLVPKTFRHLGNDKRICLENLVKVGDVCVGCGIGSFYSKDQKKCVHCPLGTYQEEEGQDKCIPCNPNDDLHQACRDVCQPGTASSDGLSPCQKCAQGFYQNEFGRIFCKNCGIKGSSIFHGSTRFEDCTTIETCKRGYYHNIHSGECEQCPKGYYQDKEGETHCIKCPGETTTDSAAATDINQCKSTECVKKLTDMHGYLQSPNYPGEYPTNVICVWNLKPGDDMRLLIFVPQLDLADDKCGDRLLIAKSESPESIITFDSCKSVNRPMAIMARTGNVIIKFESDEKHTAKGFRISFVVYDAQYESLIENIVQDSRLYAFQNHLKVLQDQNLLELLMQVIERPQIYFMKYSIKQDSLLPGTLIDLLTEKVKAFFTE